MLNFAEQTGSGAVMLVWSFPIRHVAVKFIYTYCTHNILSQAKTT